MVHSHGLQEFWKKTGPQGVLKDNFASHIWSCLCTRRVLRTNAELNSSLGHADLVRFIKSQKLSWLGHVERIEEKRIPKKILKDKMHGT
jgi:hypothetical protein